MIVLLVILIAVVSLLVVAIGLALCQPQPLRLRDTGTPANHSAVIVDKYKTYEELQAGLRLAGLESSSLIFAVDYTRSNEWAGTRTFAGKSLHTIDAQRQNPYQMVIEIMGRTLEAFDDDKLIPAYGFGDQSTTDRSIFPFYPENRPCTGFSDVLLRYNEITPHILLAGPTSFAPIIRQAIQTVRETRSYHILVIIADGQITNEAETTRAIIDASHYALSIIVVGVGDGPWDMMVEYDDGLPERRFDNFQFVSFDDVLKRHDGSPLAFATMAMQEIPDQYKAIKALKYL